MNRTVADFQSTVKASNRQADAIWRMLASVSPPEQSPSLGTLIRLAREERRMQKKELAGALETNAVTIRRLERDESPATPYLARLAMIFPEHRDWFRAPEDEHADLRGEILELRRQVIQLTEIALQERTERQALYDRVKQLGRIPRQSDGIDQ